MQYKKLYIQVQYYDNGKIWQTNFIKILFNYLFNGHLMPMVW